MSIFQADSAVALELIAIALGLFLLIWFKMHAEKADKSFRFFAYLIIIIGILTLLCTSYYSTRYWMTGYFDHSRAMMIKPVKVYRRIMPPYGTKQNTQMQDQRMPMMRNRHFIQPKDMHE